MIIFADSRHPIRVPNTPKKTAITEIHVSCITQQLHDSPGIKTRKLFKPSKDVTNLLVWIKKFFSYFSVISMKPEVCRVLLCIFCSNGIV